MPKAKQRPAGEKIVEEYFPVDESDIKYAVEKPHKQIATQTMIVKPGKKLTRPRAYSSSSKSPKKTYSKKSYAKKATSRASPAERFSPQKVSLKKDGYELIITEKPQAAQKLASALGKAVKKNFLNVPYYEVERDGKELVIACTVGHLLTLKQNTQGSAVPVFDVSWVPNYLAIKKDFTKRYFETLSKLAKGASEITVATDYDVEGEVIGLNAVRFICGQKDAQRMKFSTLTDSELNEAYEHKADTLNWAQAIAGETRHYLDWFYGINLSRALMNAIKTTGRFKIMSIGRVQGPALNMIVEKERKIQAFKSQPYWQIFITIKNSHEIELQHNKDIFDKKELTKFEGLVGKTAKAETKKKEQILPPNPPFNLTELQMEAYRLFGITPARTLQIAQSLYLAGLISYPRTSSQKLPASIGYKEILKKLSREFNVENLIKRNTPVEGKKTDPAHPSIYPTAQNEGTPLNAEEEKIYNLIVKRFLSLFCEDAIIDNKTITAKVNDLTFNTKGAEIRKKAWLQIYPTKMKEHELPDINGDVKIIDMRTEEKETQPPKRYSEASIIAELEKRNLGTKATRANIIETLYDRNYVREKSIEATPLGISLITTLEKYSPVIIDEALTREFEKDIEQIEGSKTNLEEKEAKIVGKAKETIIKIAEHFEKNQKNIGEELVKATDELREIETEENKLIHCPKCEKGMLGIKYSKKTRRFFVACDAYPDCKTTFSLPPNGVIKKTGKV
ncbi:MAG: DNA topoisomerase I, partial [Parcubacteria group bacterium]